MKVRFRAPNLSQPIGDRAQAATEYMIITAVVMAASGIIFFYALQVSNQSLAMSKANEAAETVAAAIDYVYSLGYGTHTVVDINLPGSVASARVADREVVFVMSIKGASGDVTAATKANATGTLPTDSGIHHIVVNYTETGVVVG